MQQCLVVVCAAVLMAVASADNTEKFAFADGTNADTLDEDSMQKLLASLGIPADGSGGVVHPVEDRAADYGDDDGANGEDRSAFSYGAKSSSVNWWNFWHSLWSFKATPAPATRVPMANAPAKKAVYPFWPWSQASATTPPATFKPSTNAPRAPQSTYSPKPEPAAITAPKPPVSTKAPGTSAPKPISAAPTPSASSTTMPVLTNVPTTVTPLILAPTTTAPVSTTQSPFPSLTNPPITPAPASQSPAPTSAAPTMTLSPSSSSPEPTSPSTTAPAPSTIAPTPSASAPILSPSSMPASASSNDQKCTVEEMAEVEAFLRSQE